MNSQERELFWQTLCSLKGNGEQDVQKLLQMIKLPKYLFRYRPVSMNSLEALRSNKLYFLLRIIMMTPSILFSILTLREYGMSI